MPNGGWDKEWILTFLKSPAEVLPGASGRVGAVRVEQNRLEVCVCVCVCTPESLFLPTYITFPLRVTGTVLEPWELESTKTWTAAW